MVKNIVIGVLVAALIGTSFWGFNEQRDKDTVLIQAENNYQRAFHDLAFQMDLLHDEIGTTLAMNSQERLSPSLADVWRITAEAQSDLGQLPLVHTPFSETEEFLYKVGDFSYRHAIRDLDQDPLTEENYEDLKVLYEQSGEIQQELRKMQSKVLNEDLRWMDVETALAGQEEPMDNSIVNGFNIINEKVEGFSEVDFGPEGANLSTNDEEIAEQLNGEEIDEQKALNVAKNFLEIDSVEGAEVYEAGEGLAYEAYTITIPDQKHGTHITMDVTEKGGHPVWMLNERDIDEEKISLNEASEKAKTFLEKNNYHHMQLVESNQYDNIGVFQFVAIDENVRIYSDGIVLEVALDEGDIIGFEGFSHLAHQQNDRDKNIELSRAEAEQRLNPNLDVKEHHVAVIKNQLENEVLCHEFYGVIGRDTYRIFINAENGREESVEKL